MVNAILLLTLVLTVHLAKAEWKEEMVRQGVREKEEKEMTVAVTAEVREEAERDKIKVKI
jgi:hypothetical protein